VADSEKERGELQQKVADLEREDRELQEERDRRDEVDAVASFPAERAIEASGE
jgi:hypothetical protein